MTDVDMWYAALMIAFALFAVYLVALQVMIRRLEKDRDHWKSLCARWELLHMGLTHAEYVPGQDVDVVRDRVVH